VDELATYVRKIDEADDPLDRHNAFGAFSFDKDFSDLHRLDPFSKPYRDAALRHYEEVACKAYDVASESDVLAYDPLDPVPFCSRSPASVGQQLGAISTIVRDFPVSPPGRVLDVGTGWGHTAEMLARTGFHVDGFDINRSYLDIVDATAKRQGLTDRLQTICAEFDQIGQLPHCYDAILFYEAFHHSLDHSKLIDDCLSRLNSSGYFIFAGEPIHADWHIPWGIRTDSLSAYCIHKFGWMELGFDEEYFLKLLHSKGLAVYSRKYVDHPIANNFIATRRGNTVPLSRVALPSYCESSWNMAEASPIRWTKGKGMIPGWMVEGQSVAFEVANHSGATMPVGLFAENQCIEVKPVASGETLRIGGAIPKGTHHVSIYSPNWRPSVVSGSLDDRLLGVAVSNLIYTDASTPA